jgi:hypothetical protein
MLYSKIFEHTEGRLVQIPGLPAMYDYEFLPQTVCVVFEPTESILNQSMTA